MLVEISRGIEKEMFFLQICDAEKVTDDSSGVVQLMRKNFIVVIFFLNVVKQTVVTIFIICQLFVFICCFHASVLM